MPVIVLYNYANLYYFMTIKKLTQRQVRWVELLSIYDFIIKYCLGLKNLIDVLSYCSNYLKEDINAHTLLPML